MPSWGRSAEMAAGERPSGEMLRRPVAVRRRRGLGFIVRSAIVGLNAPSTSFATGWVDQLLDLCDRRASGVLSDEEFAREKARILSS
jgi:hypothetical protein